MSEQKRDKVFLSYSHKDKKWMEKLKILLKPLIKKGEIIVWDDSNIEAGQKWNDEIITALETTKIAVLLVSENFLASDFITDVELPALLNAAEKGECTLCWILISACLYEEYGLNKFQAAHDIKRPLESLKPPEAQKTMAEIAREIKRLYEEEVKIPPPRQKQIKILSITASPEGVDSINYEMEQDIMLEAFRSLDREEVFLDMPDPVKSTLTEIAEHLNDGKHDILHITAHGGIDKKGEGVLSLEDQWGKPHEVTGELLLRALVPPPGIVILSACHSARQEPDLMPAAQSIFKAGIDVVIGMKKAVSHFAAIEFNVAFFNALSQNKTIKQAFEQGKDAILKWEQQRIRDMPDRDALKEYEIPQLLVRKKDENLTREDFSDHRIEAPGRPESHHFMGAKYLERGFIGRRQVLRDIYKNIENKEGAIVLKGPGGIGKSTLTTRAAANLRFKGYDFIVIQGETTIEQILEAISDKAGELGIKGANEVYAADADVKAKLGWFLDNFLLKKKLVIIFDNFEENQDEEKGDFHRERLKKFLWFFRDALKNKETFLFFSTRYSLPGFTEPGITKQIPEFSPVEFRKMLRTGKALKRMDSKSIKSLGQEIGGNPRGIELLAKIAHEEFRQQNFSWDRLKELIPELHERIIQKPGAGDDFTPLFLDKLFTYLSEPQRLLLDILAIYRNPVPEPTIKAHKVSMKKTDRGKLVDLSLLECIDAQEENLYYVHRLTAHYLLSQMENAVVNKYHLQAAQYFENLRTEEGKVYLYDDIEARWHYLQAGEWDKAADITFSLEKHLTLHGFPQWSMELLQELELTNISEENQAVAYHRIGTLYFNFGDYEKTLSHYEKSLKIFEKRNDIKGVSDCLHNIGAIYREKGEYDEALKQCQKALKISEKIGDIKGVSYSLHQVGMIYEDKGNYDEALKQHQKSMEIKEKIGDIEGVSNSLHQIGMIYQYKGEYDEALKQYQKALEISEKIGDIKGVSSSLHNIGTIYQEKGEYDEALKLYQKAKETFEKIGDIKSVSKSLHQVGMIYQYKGDYDEALKQYQKSLEISEKIGDIPGLANSMGQMGNLYVQKKEFAIALEFFIRAFLIFTNIGSPNANKARNDIDRCRENLPEEQFQAILRKFEIRISKSETK
jgi:tetratricopeptide (TPR) repeat protein